MILFSGCLVLVMFGILWCYCLVSMVVGLSIIFGVLCGM